MQGFTCFRALVVELDDALFAAIAIPCTKYPVSQEALVVAAIAAVVAVGVRLPLSLSALEDCPVLWAPCLVRCPSTPALSGSAHLRQAGIRFPHPGPGGSDQATCLDLPTSDKLGLGIPIQGQEAQIKQPVQICPPWMDELRSGIIQPEPMAQAGSGSTRLRQAGIRHPHSFSLSQDRSQATK